MATTAMDYENANGDRFDGMSPSLHLLRHRSSLPCPAVPCLVLCALAPVPAPAPDALRMNVACGGGYSLRDFSLSLPSAQPVLLAYIIAPVTHRDTPRSLSIYSLPTTSTAHQ